MRGRDWAANSWVNDDELVNDGLREVDQDRAECLSLQPKNSAEAGVENKTLPAKISARSPNKVGLFGKFVGMF